MTGCRTCTRSARALAAQDYVMLSACVVMLRFYERWPVEGRMREEGLHVLHSPLRGMNPLPSAIVVEPLEIPRSTGGMFGSCGKTNDAPCRRLRTDRGAASHPVFSSKIARSICATGELPQVLWC